MIQILYTQDHMTRAVALTSVVPLARHGLVNTTPPIAIPGLHTLTFWGHGDPGRFCDHSPSELVKLIGKWKKLNSKLKTVELITCNARHCTQGDPLASKIKSGLRMGFLHGTAGIKVKALPVTVTGKRNAFSILLAEPNYKSWAYITAPGTNDGPMMEAQNLIRYDAGQNGGAVPYQGDLAVKANKVARDHPVRNWTVNFGYFNTLRSCLVDV